MRQITMTVDVQWPNLAAATQSTYLPGSSKMDFVGSESRGSLPVEQTQAITHVVTVAST